MLMLIFGVSYCVRRRKMAEEIAYMSSNLCAGSLSGWILIDLEVAWIRELCVVC